MLHRSSILPVHLMRKPSEPSILAARDPRGLDIFSAAVLTHRPILHHSIPSFKSSGANHIFYHLTPYHSYISSKGAFVGED